jgi:hypothetical protein
MSDEDKISSCAEPPGPTWTKVHIAQAEIRNWNRAAHQTFILGASLSRMASAAVGTRNHLTKAPSQTEGLVMVGSGRTAFGWAPVDRYSAFCDDCGLSIERTEEGRWALQAPLASLKKAA